jgi:hypothetical protein
MAKKQAVNKTQAVRDYLKTHRGAMSKEIATALNKQGIKIKPSHVANIKSQINKTRTAKKAVAAKKAPAAEPVVVAPEKATNTITIEQVKAVAQTVKAIGGFSRLNDLLGLIKEVGGVKRFKDLLEAMSGTDVDAIPF